MNTEDRARIIARIKALLAKTTEAGATQDEALAATAKATALMDRHGISFADVQGQKDEGFASRALSQGALEGRVFGLDRSQNQQVCWRYRVSA